MTKIISIAVIAAAILLAGTAVVYAQTNNDTPLQHMPMWGDTNGAGGNYYDDMLDYCVGAGGTSEQAQEHYRQMEEHMQDGTWQEHMGNTDWQDMQQHMDEYMGDGTWQNHMGDGTYQNHMGDGTYQNHIGDGTWQEHHGTAGTDSTGYGHMGGGMGM